MRIRSIAIAYMSGMGLLAVAGAATLAFQNWARLHAVTQAEALIQVIASANHFVEAMALERGVYNQVLVSRDDDLEGKKALVAERVRATDAVFDQSLATLSAMDARAARPFTKLIEQARASVSAARMRADKVLQAGSEQNRALAARQMLADYVTSAAVLDEAMVRIERSLAERDPRLGLLMGVSRLANQMRELAGQRSTLLSRYAGTRQQHDAATAGRVAELTGGIKITWEQLQTVVRQVGHPPKVVAAVAQILSTFMDEGERTYAQMADAARQGTPPPVEFLTWRAWTVAMLTNILAARDAPVEQALDDVDGLKRTAWAHLVMAAAAAFGAGVIVFAAAFFVQRRIVVPIARLTTALEHVGEQGADQSGAREADRATSLVDEDRPDEIGSLSRALKRFQERTAEIGELNQRFDATLENLPQGLCVFDQEHRLVVCNARYEEIYRLKPEHTLRGTSLEALTRQRSWSGTLVGDPDAHIADMLERIARGEPWESTTELADGRAIAVRWQPMPNGGWISTHEDITSRLRYEAQISYMAHHDALTALPNRTFFQQELTRALADLGDGATLALLCLDLDGFKVVNDTLGHPTGDVLLRQVADRLITSVPAPSIVARLGGDEFAIIQTAGEQPNAAAELASKLIGVLGVPYSVGGNRIVIGTSVGIAIPQGLQADPDELLKAADVALYQAKADGRGTCRFFEPELNERMQSRRELELDLREALDKNQFELEYQPFVDVQTGRVNAFEALVRWNHPVRGRVAPSEFIPIAEESGSIGPIGAWVLREACREAASWPSDISLAVNLSPMQFRTGQLELEVISALGASGLSPRRLELEITETALLLDTNTTVSVLGELRQLGVRIAMDDFGTGYSSLSYVRKFPFDKIKIDRSFVRDLATDSGAASIVRAIAELGSSLGMIVTAEGVETQEQLKMLVMLGCKEAQGYLFARPASPQHIPEMIGSVSAFSVAAA